MQAANRTSKSPMNHMTVKELMSILLNGLLFLFFFQLVSDFVEAIYAFGLMGTDIPVEIVFVLFFFSPIILLILPKGITGWPLIVVGEIMLEIGRASCRERV